VIQSKRGRILSVGCAVPPQTLTNKDLEKILDTTDEWIVQRTGIRQRHIVGKNENVFAYEIGARAAQAALSKAGLTNKDVDGIICATFTPDYFFPSTACKIQGVLGCTNSFAFDISAACSGFVYALSVANAMIVSGDYTTILVVGVEIASKTLDWTDRSTSILFGDGAGAVVLQAAETEGKGILSTFLKSDGSLGDILYLPAWGEKRFMKMNGNEVYKHAVRMMSEAVLIGLDKAGLGIEKIDLLIPHQANLRIISAISSHLKVPMEKIVCNMDRYSNTGSASIPLALQDAWSDGRIKDGALVVFTSLGGGLAAGSVVVRF
jgi:3-oxoacyl-(acyl-carrier-protein) synthase III